MRQTNFPVIDPAATGANILRLRKARGLTVRDLQAYFGFEEPQAIYKWQSGKSLPSVDNLYALGALLEVPMEDILVPARQLHIAASGQQDRSCCPLPVSRLLWVQQASGSGMVYFCPAFPSPASRAGARTRRNITKQDLPRVGSLSKHDDGDVSGHGQWSVLEKKRHGVLGNGG